jgi:hypothetical protein
MAITDISTEDLPDVAEPEDHDDNDEGDEVTPEPVGAGGMWTHDYHNVVTSGFAQVRLKRRRRRRNQKRRNPLAQEQCRQTLLE